jgi:hypothetical protein
MSALAAILGLVLAAAASPATPASGAPGCEPARWSGRVRAIEPADARPRRGAEPAVLRAGRRIPIVEGEPLCADEVVENPAGSGQQVTITAAGGVLMTLKAGETHATPRATVMTWASGVSQAFGRIFSADEWSRPSAVRGLTVGSATPALAGRVKAVADWGPLIIAWPAGDDLDPTWRVTVRGPAGAIEAPHARNVAWIDIRKACPSGCRVLVERDHGPLAINVTIEVVAAAVAPGPEAPANVTDSPPQAALQGEWLLDRSGDPAWRLQGAAMIWRAACAFPPLLSRLHELYGDFPEELVCSGTAGSAGP